MLKHDIRTCHDGVAHVIAFNQVTLICDGSSEYGMKLNAPVVTCMRCVVVMATRKLKFVY